MTAELNPNNMQGFETQQKGGNTLKWRQFVRSKMVGGNLENVKKGITHIFFHDF